jgi:hypothetical protein
MLLIYYNPSIHKQRVPTLLMKFEKNL